METGEGVLPYIEKMGTFSSVHEKDVPLWNLPQTYDASI